MQDECCKNFAIPAFNIYGFSFWYCTGPNQRDMGEVVVGASRSRVNLILSISFCKTFGLCKSLLDPFCSCTIFTPSTSAYIPKKLFWTSGKPLTWSDFSYRLIGLSKASLSFQWHAITFRLSYISLSPNHSCFGQDPFCALVVPCLIAAKTVFFQKGLVLQKILITCSEPQRSESGIAKEVQNPLLS